MFEPATNIGLERFIARKERERRGVEFWAALDREVLQMRHNRLCRELKISESNFETPTTKENIMPFGMAFADHRNVFKTNNYLPKSEQKRKKVKSKSNPIALIPDSTGKVVTGPPVITREEELKRNVINPKPRLASIQKDISVCFYCEVTLSFITADHIIPVSRGAHPRGVYNMVYACSHCNEWKANYSLELFREFISRSEIPHRKSRIPQLGRGQIALMCANIDRLIEYRDTNPLMIKLVNRLKLRE